MLFKLKNLYHFLLAWIGAVIYRHPSRKLVVIGITGTKGKTTSTELLRAVLQGAGKKIAMLSSAHIAYGDEIVTTPFHNTMPGRMFIQKFLRTALAKGCTHAVFEVTSQGVVQHRHRFIDFDVAALTCLHPEHIESHGGYEQYRGAKVQFFRDVARLSRKEQKYFFINTETGGDAQFFEESVRHPTGQGHFGEVVFYNRENFVRNSLKGEVGRVSEWLQSDFNLQNAALVYEIARALRVSSESILDTYKSFKGVSGRLEFIRAKGKTVVIDYALTPGSLRALYSYLTNRLTDQPTNGSRGRLIAVFGSAGGGRDTWKRPELGKIADEFCDAIYLTTDDSYDEPTEAIIADIKKGISHQEKVTVIVDRGEAIAAALRAAAPNDIVAITGMGSQTKTYGPKGVELDWSDRKAVEEALSKYPS